MILLSVALWALGIVLGVAYERSVWKRRYRDAMPLPDAVESASPYAEAPETVV